MPKRSLRKFLPTPARLRDVKGLGMFRDLFDRHELWHISRTSIARASAIGLFCAMVPLPGQMIVAVFIAIRVGANVPLAFSLIFITNPLTMPVIYLAAYLLGSALLNAPVIDASAVDWLDPTSPELLSIWPSFLVGVLLWVSSSRFLAISLPTVCGDYGLHSESRRGHACVVREKHGKKAREIAIPVSATLAILR